MTKIIYTGKSLVMTAVIFGLVHSAYGQATSTPGASGTSTSTYTTTAGTAAGSSTGSGIQQTAKGASTMQVAGMIAGGVAAGVCAVGAVGSCPSCAHGGGCTPCFLYVLGTVAGLGVAGIEAEAAMKSKKTGTDVSDGNGDDPGGGGNNVLGGGNNPTQYGGDIPGQLRSAMNQVPGLGADLNTGVVTLPDGRKIDTTSPSSLASNLSPGEQAQLKGIMDQAAAAGNAAALKAATDGKDLTNGDDGTAGRAGGPTTTTVDAGGAKPGGARAAIMGGGRGLAATGLTRNLDGQAIGAAGDNIFRMIDNRYTLENQHQAFIGSPPAPKVATGAGI